MLRGQFPTLAEVMTSCISVILITYSPFLTCAGLVPGVNGPELLPVSGAASPCSPAGSQGCAEKKLQSEECNYKQISSVFQFRWFVLGLNLLLPFFCSLCVLFAEG